MLGALVWSTSSGAIFHAPNFAPNRLYRLNLRSATIFFQSIAKKIQSIPARPALLQVSVLKKDDPGPQRLKPERK
jgi:hypothetical protein